MAPDLPRADGPLGAALRAALVAGRPLDRLDQLPGGPVDVVDSHGHLGAWEAFWIPRQDVASMRAVMARCGVRRIAISSLLGIGPDTIAGNARVADVVASDPDRFLGYVVANPHRPAERDGLDALLAEPGFVGVKVHPSTHFCAVDDDRYTWIWELAAARDAVVLAHSQAECPYSHPRRFAAVASRFPSLRMILAHAGVTPDGFRATAALLADHEQLVTDVCGSHITGDWIRWLVREAGADRVLYGSDMPFIDLRFALGRVVGAGLADDDLRAVLGGNARRLLERH